MNNTQLTDPQGFDTKNIIFSKPENKQIPNEDPSAPKMFYKTIRIGTRNPDGTKGDLVFGTTELFSFGVSENTEMGSTRVNGYTMPLCLWSKDGATPGEEAFVNTFNSTIERIKRHVLDSKDEIEKYDLEESELKKLNPLYWKRERGKIVEGQGPTLYAKLLYKKGADGGKILSDFTHFENESTIDPMTLVKKYCFVTAAIKIESIYIGTKISVQLKLVEAIVRPLESGPKKLLRPTSNPTVTVTTSASDALQQNSESGSEDAGSDDDDDGSDAGSLDEDDGAGSKAEPEPEPEPAPVVPKRRVVRKKAQ